jgi:hypothetical protein
MAVAAMELSKFSLPTRIRSKKPSLESLSARLELAQRIAELPGTRTEDHEATLPCGVDVFLQAPQAPLRKRRPDSLLCHVGSEGVRVFGLNAWQRHQVVLRGWGNFLRDGVLMHLPRDSNELEVCWDVVRRAYDTLFSGMAEATPVCTVWQDDLPRFSRTRLQ